MSPAELKGKTILITGATRRIGKNITLAMARSKANVIIHYHQSEKQALKLVQQAKQSGVKAWAVKGDLASPDGITEWFTGIRQKTGRIDILINNASIFFPSSLNKLEKNLGTFLDINSLSPLVLARNFAGQTENGCIVNLLDNRIKGYDLTHAAYQLSKNILYSLTRMMAIQMAPGIRVNGIAPGLILPPAGKGHSFLKKMALRNLLKRSGKAEDITKAVEFLITSPFITGEVIVIDGGETLKQLEFMR